eukprot:TRINITY_DN143_c0_g1_i2.p1 TRINITY_DN143_c0_g1~~TRINITY_DN143_c0_g1_i2.p1  ORF type:complete len:218 (+),score=-8.67 TRINITY_DN143_c0_g1_i2:1067-1720(+)
MQYLRLPCRDYATVKMILILRQNVSQSPDALFQFQSPKSFLDSIQRLKIQGHCHHLFQPCLRGKDFQVEIQNLGLFQISADSHECENYQNIHDHLKYQMTTHYLKVLRFNFEIVSTCLLKILAPKQKVQEPKLVTKSFLNNNINSNIITSTLITNTTLTNWQYIEVKFLYFYVKIKIHYNTNPKEFPDQVPITKQLKKNILQNEAGCFRVDGGKKSS